MTTEEVRYDRLTPFQFQERLGQAAIAYLPLGTLEWHCTHLPLGSDSLQAEAFFVRLARRVGGIVLPPIFLGPDGMKEADGFEYYGMDIYGFPRNAPQQLPGSAYWVSSELFLMLIEAILRQVRRAGFRIVVAQGHGPSTDLVIKNAPEFRRELDLTVMSVWRSLSRDISEKPLAIIGKDPRTHASAEHGEDVIELHLQRMEGLLKNQLAKLREAGSGGRT
jgi:creatinine amidohydrolase